MCLVQLCCLQKKENINYLLHRSRELLENVHDIVQDEGI
jgi:hypothetical protein